MSLTEFLLARIVEDETRANAMQHWQLEPYEQYHACPAARDPASCGDLEYGEENCECGLAHNKAHALAECAAKRQLIEYVEDVAALMDDVGERGTPESILKVFASIYADHPDYQQEWKP